MLFLLVPLLAEGVIRPGCNRNRNSCEYSYRGAFAQFPRNAFGHIKHLAKRKDAAKNWSPFAHKAPERPDAHQFRSTFVMWVTWITVSACLSFWDLSEPDQSKRIVNNVRKDVTYFFFINPGWLVVGDKLSNTALILPASFNEYWVLAVSKLLQNHYRL